MKLINNLVGWFIKQPGRIKFTLVMMCAAVSLILSAVISTWVLWKFHLAYRHWVVSAYIIILLLTLVMFIYGCIYCLQLYNRKFFILIRVAGSITLVAFSVRFIFTCALLALLFIVSRRESVVERNGVKMYVMKRNIEEVNLEYYDYANLFVRGEFLRINERYDHGYSPAGSSVISTISPSRIQYYDESGYLLKEDNFLQGAN